MKRLSTLLILLSGLFYFTNVFAQTTHEVEVVNFEFVPADITIKLGDTVKWIWVEGTHTTTSDATSGDDSWSEPIDAANQEFSIVLTTEGLHRYYCIPHGGPGGEGMSGTITVEPPTDVKDEIASPIEYSLNQNYPNPFNPSTRINYSIKQKGNVKIDVYNITGNKVKELVNSFQQPGNYNIEFNAAGLTSGVYFYRITAGSFTETRKMILLR